MRSMLAFWMGGAAGPSGAPLPGVDGAGIRFLHGRRRLHPDEIEREQRMVDEYLAALDQAKKVAQKLERAPARIRKKAQVPVPVLTQQMVQAANDLQINRILEAAAAAEEDRRKARAEFERRYWASFLALAMNE